MTGFICLLAGVLAVGFLFGVAVKAFLDKDEIHDLETKNAALKRENAYLRKNVKREVIEIIDPRVKGVKFPSKEGF